MFQPRTNYPQAILDFIQAITLAVTSPDSLKPLVAAAQEVAGANKLSDEQEQQYANALETIADAKKQLVDLAATRQAVEGEIARLEELRGQNAQVEQDIADKRTQLAGMEERSTARADKLTEGENSLADDQATLARNLKDYGTRMTALKKREDAQAVREDRWKQAQNLVNSHDEPQQQIA